MTSIPWNCKQCGAEIGQIVRGKFFQVDCELPILICTTGHRFAGRGSAPCPACGELQTWEPGRKMLEDVIAATGRELPERVL
jgi:hypothetical protein